MHRIVRRLSFSPSFFSNSNRAFAETPNLVRGSTIWRQRNSFATCTAAIASDDASSEAPKRSKKRVSTDDRRLMVKSYVNNYRAMNSGKFPTASATQKEVGGSYYFVRKVVQQMQYESHMSSSSVNVESLKTEVNKEISNLKGALSSHIGVEAQTTDETLVDNIGAISKNSLGIHDQDLTCGMKDEFEIPVDAEKVHEVLIGQEMDAREEGKQPEVPLPGPKMLGTEVPMNDDASGIGTPDGMEAAKKTNLSSEGKPVSDCQIAEDNVKERTIPKDDQQPQSPKTEEIARDMSKEHSDDAESPKKSFAWKQLKSLADGIINLWRKL